MEGLEKTLPELVVLEIAKYLSPEDCVRLSMTCKTLYNILPKYVCFYGDDFKINGPLSGHWAPELYFDGPELRGKVKRFRATVNWKDQGWGNRKGRLMVNLMRRSATGETKVAENVNLFGVAAHQWKEYSCLLVDDDVVKLAEAGDFYRFERNAGGGGGHSLSVKYFAVLLEHPS